MLHLLERGGWCQERDLMIEFPQSSPVVFPASGSHSSLSSLDLHVLVVLHRQLGFSSPVVW